VRGRTPTVLQRAFAWRHLHWTWVAALSTGFFAGFICAGYSTIEPAGGLDHSTIAALVLGAVLSAALSFVGGVLAAAVTLGPVGRARMRANGGPYEPGETVRIIGGIHDGLTTTVREIWMGQSVRIDLPSKKSEFDDVFNPLWIMRVDAVPPAVDLGQ
jgi:hypothetical protein